MCFVDQKDESFYTLSWACSIDGSPFLVAGGINGIIRVIDTGSEKIHKVLFLGLVFFYNIAVVLAQSIGKGINPMLLFGQQYQSCFYPTLRDVYTFRWKTHIMNCIYSLSFFFLNYMHLLQFFSFFSLTS